MPFLHGWVVAQPINPSFEHYTTDNGLSSDYITTILKDRRGFMWVGTSNGLNRFDGLRFRVFKRTETRQGGQIVQGGMLGNYVVQNGLTEGPDGLLWVATNRGLFRFDPLRETFRLIPTPPLTDSLADNDYVSPLRFAPDGSGWFSTKYKLYRMHSATLRLTEYALPRVVDNAYAEPFFDRKGRFWLNQAGVVYQFDPKTRRYRYVDGTDEAHPNAPRSFQMLRETPDGHLLAPANAGLMRFDTLAGRFVSVPGMEGYVGDVLTDRLPDGQPLFWLGGGPTGLMAHLPTTRQTVLFRRTPADPLSFNGKHVMTIFRDTAAGIIWLGTTRGLEKIDPTAIKFERKLLNLPPDDNQSQFVVAVRQDRRDDDLHWLIVRDVGLMVWHRQTGEVQTVPLSGPGALPEPSPRDIMDVAQDNRGHLWVCTRGGVFDYDPTTRRQLFRTDFLPKINRNRHILNTAVMHPDGAVWVGSGYSGLYRIDPATGQGRLWPLRADAKQPGVSRLQVDTWGNLWALTNEGLYCLDPRSGSARRLRLHGSAVPVRPSDRLQSTFFIDRKGQLWLTGIGFVARADLDGRIRQTFTLADGLKGDHIFAVADDERGHIWLTTDDLLHELNPQTGQFTYYDKGSGLLDRMVFMPCAITQNRQGELFFGYPGGFNYVRPDRLRRNAVPPPVAITALRVNNQPRVVDTLLALQPGETALTVEFAALGYSQPDKNRYAYQLVGFDQDWVKTNDRSATYTNLEPGSYTLRVKGANSDGVWNEMGATLHLRVVPAFWQTNWFRLLCVVLVAGLLYAIYRYRERQRQRLEHIRERIAKDLHDDMGSTLSSIRMFSDVVQQQIAPVRPEAVPALERISRSATTLSESMQDIIWTIQTDHDTLADVVARMREFGLRMAESRGIAFEMHVPDNVGYLKLSLEQRRNLHLIVKESINNAVKYADCTRLTVRLTVENRTLRLLIQDNGRGFDPATVRRGNGLNNLHKRAEELGGTFRLESAPGQGTLVEVTTKL